MIEEISVNGSGQSGGLTKHHANSVLKTVEVVERRPSLMTGRHEILASLARRLHSLGLERTLEHNRAAHAYHRVEEIEIGQLAVGTLEFELEFAHVRRVLEFEIQRRLNRTASTVQVLATNNLNF